MGATDVVHDLTLMLMFLTSWQEREGEPRRCWKGYDFAILDRLDGEGLISNSHRAKSAYLNPEGEAQAKKLLAEHGLEVE